jgi:hypothetical protein
MNIKIKDPVVVKNILSEEEFSNFSNYLFNRPKLDIEFDKSFGRYAFHDPEIDRIADILTPIARRYFDSENLMPSYSLFGHYEGKQAQLWKHKDDNACTYTLDMCIYQKETWDLWVDDKSYTLYPNEALAYYGNDQLHWREDFPNKDTNHVAMVFFHFVEPEHWYFTKGPSYLEVIRGIKTEEQWNAEQP